MNSSLSVCFWGAKLALLVLVYHTQDSSEVAGRSGGPQLINRIWRYLAGSVSRASNLDLRVLRLSTTPGTEIA